MSKLTSMAAANILAGDLVMCGPDDLRRVERVRVTADGMGGRERVCIDWDRATVPAGKNFWTVKFGDSRVRVVPALVAPAAQAGGFPAGIRAGWEWDRRRRTSRQAAKWSNGPGSQRIGGCAGMPAWRLFDPQPAAAVAGRALHANPLDDSTVCVTPAGAAALDRAREHGWTWDLDLAVRPGETARYMRRRGSEDDVREREQLPADHGHDLAECLCVRCAGERRAARALAGAVERRVRRGVQS